MTRPAAPKISKLPVDDPKLLLEALQGTVDPDQLQAIDRNVTPDGTYTSVHSRVLAYFLIADSLEHATLLYSCCERLISLGAPLVEREGHGAAHQFAGFPWPTSEGRHKQVASLCDAYVAAGLYDLNASMPGERLTRAQRDEDGFGTGGVVPLAAAILMPDPLHAAYLIERGASTDLGQVYTDEAPVTAIELAAEWCPEIHAMLAERVLRQHIAPSAPATGGQPRPRRAGV